MSLPEWCQTHSLQDFFELLEPEASTEYSSNKKTKEDFNNYVNNLTETKRKDPMNVETNFTPVAEANAVATAPLTDAQLEAIFATRADGTYVSEVDEVAEDTPVLN